MTGRVPETQAGTGKPSDMSPSPVWVKTSAVCLCGAVHLQLGEWLFVLLGFR